MVGSSTYGRIFPKEVGSLAPHRGELEHRMVLGLRDKSFNRVGTVRLKIATSRRGDLYVTLEHRPRLLRRSLPDQVAAALEAAGEHHSPRGTRVVNPGHYPYGATSHRRPSHSTTVTGFLRDGPVRRPCVVSTYECGTIPARTSAVITTFSTRCQRPGWYRRSGRNSPGADSPRLFTWRTLLGKTR